MRAVKVAFSTMGASSPASVAEDAGRSNGYRWHGIPGWKPGRDPETLAAASTTEANRQRRRERVARFTAALKEIAPHAKPGSWPSAAILEAGRRAGVGPSTAREYAKELLRGADS